MHTHTHTYIHAYTAYLPIYIHAYIHIFTPFQVIEPFHLTVVVHPNPARGNKEEVVLDKPLFAEIDCAASTYTIFKTKVIVESLSTYIHTYIPYLLSPRWS